MKRYVEFMIFFSVFSTIYYLMHLYVFFRISVSFADSLLLALVSFSFIISNFLLRLAYNIITRIIYFISAVWMGFVFILFSLLLLYELVRPFVTLPILYIAIAVSIYATINSFYIRIKKISIPSKKKLRAVLLTDIHVGTIRNKNFLRKIADMTNNLSPDIVFITGDIVDGSAPLRKGMFDALKQIKAPKYFTTGNHELYEGTEKVIDLLDGDGIKVLQNKTITFKGHKIIGVEYGTNLDEVLNDAKDAIVLNHTPTQFDYAASKKIKLMLSGHTHNGQIIPFNLLVRIAYRRIKGLYIRKDSFLYVSPGTGTWGPPMRLGSRNEITLIELG